MIPTKKLAGGILAAAAAGFLWYNLSVSSSTIKIAGASMYPTLSDGQEVYIHIRAADEYPSRSKIVIIRRNGENYVKRVIALPGETVDIREGIVYIDKTALCLEGGIDPAIPDECQFPITLSENEYFVMGDNRTNSWDSRSNSFGLVSLKEILAVVELP